MSLPNEEEEHDVVEALPVEQPFGRYRLSHQLASGGMGTVYLARSKGPGGFEKVVALKRIHAHLAENRRFVNMFLDEARIAAQIQHPNVCSVMDFGEVDGRYYLTMPYIAGEPLHRVYAAAVGASYNIRAQLPWMACRLVADACEGLHAAHELRDDQGRLLDVVHRDVSPQNLMLGYDGGLRVLDFGVASARDRLHRTNTGEVKGKFAYLAPEQLEEVPADRRTDVWALGVVLWEGICGQRLFARESMAATIRAVTERPIPPLSECFPDAPLGLEEVVGKALARDPERRYRSARDLGRDLLALLAEEQRFIGPADVADWMKQLFPEGSQGRVDLLADLSVHTLDGVSGVTEKNDAERALALPPPPPGASLPPPVYARPEAGRDLPTAPKGLPSLPDPGPAAVAPRASASGPPQSDAAPPGQSSASESAPAAVPPPPSSRSRLPWGIGIALVLAVSGLVGGGLGLWATFDEDGSLASAPESPEASTEEEAPTAESPEAEAPERGAAGADLEELAVRAERNETPEDLEGATAEPETAEMAEIETAEPETAEPETAEPEQRSSARTRRSPPATGTVFVNVPGGWAYVYHRGERLGETPGTFELPVGRQTLGVQLFGQGEIQQRRVYVPSRGGVRLSVPAH